MGGCGCRLEVSLSPTSHWNNEASTLKFNVVMIVARNSVQREKGVVVTPEAHEEPHRSSLMNGSLVRIQFC